MITLKKLHDLLWSTPVSKLAKEFNLTPWGLKKICKEYNIPLPDSGYWSKLKYGKKVEKVPLPDSEADKQIDFSIYDENGEKVGTEKSNFYQRKKEIETKFGSYIKVKEKLSQPDKLIQEAKKHLQGKSPSMRVNIREIIRPSSEVFQIEVSKENMNRSLRICDAFIKTLKARGHTIQFDRGTIIVVYGEPIRFRFREVLKRVTKKDRSWDYMELYPSGLLSIKIGDFSTKEFKESKSSPLEDKLSTIVAEIEIIAIKKKEDKARHEKWRREYELKKKAEEELRGLREKELEKFKELLSLSERWNKANNLRLFLKEVEITQKQVEPEKKVDWLDWAKDKADWYDPLIEKKDDFLDNANKYTL